MFASPCTESSTGILKLSDTNYDTVTVALHYIYTSEVRDNYAIKVRLQIVDRLIQEWTIYVDGKTSKQTFMSMPSNDEFPFVLWEVAGGS